MRKTLNLALSVLIFSFLAIAALEVNARRAGMDLTANESFDSCANFTLNAADSCSGGQLVTTSATTYNSNPSFYSTTIGGAWNKTCEWEWNNLVGNTGSYYMFLGNDIGATPSGSPYDIRGQVILFDGTNNNVVTNNGAASRTTKISFIYNDTTGTPTFIIYEDGVQQSSKKVAKSTNPFLYWTLAREPSVTYNINWFVCYNDTVRNLSKSETTAPSITYYNLTDSASGNLGCENWNTNRNDACVTSSVLPTIQFNTSESSWCSIAAGVNSSSYNINFSNMGASRECSGAASGHGTTGHLCTVNTQDEIFYETSYVFISCKDFDNNQNLTSTSGPLAINLTNLESVSRNSIEIGIRNSLQSGYSTFTDQKVYARNSANNQSVSRFDKIAKKSNKIWAFNRIGQGDNYVSMFNITPVFYTLEFANKTTEQIINGTSLLINSTR